MIEFLESTHQYLFNGVIVPSVSEIMKPLSSNYYKDIDENILQMACDRGSAIHLATEMIDQELEYEIKDTWKDYVLQYKKFLALRNPKIIEIEQKLGCEYYAGTLDRIYEIDNELWLVDIKTSAKINDKLVSVQLAGYSNLLNNKEIKHFGVLHLTKKGFTLKEIEPNFEIWNSLLQIYLYNNS